MRGGREGRKEDRGDQKESSCTKKKLGVVTRYINLKNLVSRLKM